MEKKGFFGTINSVLAKNFQKFGARPAMILDSGRTISYSDMRWDIFKTSQVLKTLGEDAPKCVAVFVDNSPQAIETVYSVLSVGAKAVLLRYTMSRDEIKAALDEQSPEAVFIRSERMDLLPEMPACGILEIADNRVIKNIDRAAYEKQINSLVSHNAEGVLAVVYSHNTSSASLTGKDLLSLAKKPRGKKASRRVEEIHLDSIFEYVSRVARAFIKGRAVKAAL